MKPKNEFEEEKEKREKARRKFYMQQREKMLRRRLGLTRTQQQVRVKGMAVAFVETPRVIRERWFISELNGRKYHFAILRYLLRSEDGRVWTALQAQVHDANYGWMLSVSGFWGFKPA